MKEEKRAVGEKCWYHTPCVNFEVQSPKDEKHSDKKMAKKRVALNLTEANAFLKDVPGVTTIVNYLLTREFGSLYLEYQENNELFEAMKIIAARRLKKRIEEEYKAKRAENKPLNNKPTKKSIALYLDPQNEFLKDVTGIALIVNYLISEEFGYNYFLEEKENELLEAQKIILAVRFAKKIKEEKDQVQIIEKLKKL